MWRVCSPGDTFNIIRFSDDATSLFPTSQPAVTINRQSATDFIEGLVADGGTEMRSALELAFSMPPTLDALRQIVFVTDGSVSNEAELVKLIGDRIGGARLFTVGIGGAPNAYFMREAAAAGRGSFTFIPQIDQVSERMGDVFRKLESPALVDLQLHWPGGAVAMLAAKLPSDVYAGDPLNGRREAVEPAARRAHAERSKRWWRMDASAPPEDRERSLGHREAVGARADLGARTPEESGRRCDGSGEPDRESRARASSRQRLHESRGGG